MHGAYWAQSPPAAGKPQRCARSGCARAVPEQRLLSTGGPWRRVSTRSRAAAAWGCGDRLANRTCPRWPPQARSGSAQLSFGAANTSPHQAARQQQAGTVTNSGSQHKSLRQAYFFAGGKSAQLIQKLSVTATPTCRQRSTCRWPYDPRLVAPDPGPAGRVPCRRVQYSQRCIQPTKTQLKSWQGACTNPMSHQDLAQSPLEADPAPGR